MGILDSLKGMVGKGSPKVEVKLLKEQATVQESVKGVATFTGGEYPVTIDSVILLMLMVEDIKEKQTTKESTEKVGKITFNDYILEPKEVISLPFQLVIPKDNLISSAAIKHYVQVQLDINGQDVFGVCEIKIV
ncbi:MAG: sporulation protein [Leptospiraceae bacterium]|jgi:sporulation-control protein spo0M|nr:sporulation protein [Leptospiraceae bacterium]MBK7056357.1 sporulation protein [Leptospiraceae bacterium]MBK9501178.1 sporulation protein [Leptospiraceae bacterium]MBK9503783.1 sporulation protein [Leptospiraceae bacterium]MBL0266643.1 sporulation protein [Leptospiraceae bacterium]